MAAQRTMRFTTFSRDLADGEGLVEQVEFVPCRPAADIEVGAEAQRVNRLADHALDRSYAAEIDDGDDFPGDIRKTVALAGENFRRSLDRSGVVAGEKMLDGGPAFGGFEIALGGDRAVLADSQDVAGIVETGMQGRQPFVPHQHQKVGLRHPFRSRRVEAAGAVFDGVAAVGRQGLADAERDARQRFRRQALDGIAVKAGDLGRRGR